MSVIREWSQQLRQGELRGLESAGYKRPTLALHGWLDNAASFIPLMRQLPAEEQWIAIDLPGHGRSYHRPEGATYPLLDWLLDLDELVDALGWDEFDLVGHSLGAAICALYTAVRPERVQRLLMIEGLGPLSEAEGSTTKRLSAALSARYRYQSRERLKSFGAPAEAATRWSQGPFGVPPASARLLCSRGLEPFEGGLRWSADTRLRARSLARLTEAQILDLLGATAPVSKLLVMGTESPFPLNAARAARVAALAPQRRLEVPGGHHCHMEEASAAEIYRVWRSLPERR